MYNVGHLQAINIDGQWVWAKLVDGEWVYPKKIGEAFLYPIKKMDGVWVWPEVSTLPIQSNMPPNDAAIGSLQSSLPSADHGGGLTSLISPPIRNFRASKSCSKTTAKHGGVSFSTEGEANALDLPLIELDAYPPSQIDSKEALLGREIARHGTKNPNDEIDEYFEADANAINSPTSTHNSNVWETPLKISKADLKAVSAFLYQQLADTGTDPNKTIDDYQDLACEEFGQTFESDEWDKWFDNEIEVLSKKLGLVDVKDSGSGNLPQLCMTPSDATEADLDAISAFLYQQLADAGTDPNKTIDDYQDLACEEFGQTFESDEWDKWFDNEIEVLSNNLKQLNALDTFYSSDDSSQSWMTPSDATEADLEAISAFLYQQLAQNNTNLIKTIDDYQDLAFSEFGQVFNSDEWDRWFANEIQKLLKKIEDGGNAIATSNMQSLDDNDGNSIATEHDKDSQKNTQIDITYNSSLQNAKTSGMKINGESAEPNVLNPQDFEDACTKNIHVPVTHTLYSWTATGRNLQVPATHTLFSWKATARNAKLPSLHAQFTQN